MAAKPTYKKRTYSVSLSAMPSTGKEQEQPKLERTNLMIWTTTLIDAGDGSGDCLLPLPDELVAQLGWKIGKKLILTVEKVGEFSLKAKYRRGTRDPIGNAAANKRRMGQSDGGTK